MTPRLENSFPAKIVKSNVRTLNTPADIRMWSELHLRKAEEISIPGLVCGLVENLV